MPFLMARSQPVGTVDAVRARVSFGSWTGYRPVDSGLLETGTMEMFQKSA